MNSGAAKPVSEAELRAALAAEYQRMEQLGLNELSSGNLSVRFEDRMLISATGATAASVNPETLVACGFDGSHDGSRKPSSEWQMHAAIYAARPEALAVVHTHSDACVALASHTMSLPGFHYLVGTFGGDDVPCVPYSTFGTSTLARDAAGVLQDRTACLLGNHGMIARGSSIKMAADTAYRLEILCRQYLVARGLGQPRLLTDKEWTEFHAAAVDYPLHADY